MGRGGGPEDPYVRLSTYVILRTSFYVRLFTVRLFSVVSSGAVAFAPDLTEEVLRVGSTPDIAAQLGMSGRPGTGLVAFALERAGWWRSFASFGATPAQARVAHVVHRAYFLIWQQLRAGGHR